MCFVDLDRYSIELKKAQRHRIKFLKKEVIQPLVPQRLPCYDFTPVISPTVVAPLLAVGVTASD